jgi:FkbM family methyltransferase
MGINFSAVASNTRAGKVLRCPLNWIPSEASVPILQGALRGKKWIVGSSTHGCWLGSYEYRKRQLFERSVRRGDVVYDVGAHVGFYTLLASILVGPNGHVVAFEPFPRNLSYLRRHLALNDVRNAVVMAGAVYDRGGIVQLTDRLDSCQVRVDDAGTLPVRAFTLDDLAFQGRLPAPTVMKIDVEGAEGAVLRGATRLLVEKRPLLFLSTHGGKVHAECCKLLVGLGYGLRPIDGSTVETSAELLAEG